MSGGVYQIVQAMIFCTVLLMFCKLFVGWGESPKGLFCIVEKGADFANQGQRKMLGGGRLRGFLRSFGFETPNQVLRAVTQETVP